MAMCMDSLLLPVFNSSISIASLKKGVANIPAPAQNPLKHITIKYSAGTLNIKSTKNNENIPIKHIRAVEIIIRLISIVLL